VTLDVIFYTNNIKNNMEATVMNSHNRSPIEHVIVLMLENRSYDHLLGYLPNGQGLTGDEFNLVDPSVPTSQRVLVSNRSGYITTVDPAHDFVSVEKQLFGLMGQVVNPAPMNGFVAVHIEKSKGDVEMGKKIMECFDPVKIPALTTLAQEFCLCDRWFSAVPGPTWLNRFFVHSATCDGMIVDSARHNYKMKTIYDTLGKNGFSWNIYYGDIPQSIILEHHWRTLDHFKRFERFNTDLEKGTLATYTFIEPRYINFHEWKATDQHPPHDVRLGEYLIAEVYDTLRRSQFWEKSLLVVLYDEHGGFFDRVSPPDPVPSPDGKKSKHPPFDFTRLGVRVPAILVSPFVEKGQVDSTIYEHSSLPATIKTLFNLPDGLTARDRAANTFEKNLSRSIPRSDTPLTLPVPGKSEEARRHRELLRTNALEKWRQGEVDQAEISQESLSPFQEALVGLGNLLNKKSHRKTHAVQIRTEYEAALHIHESLAHFLEREKEESHQ
jgi:phospholipase C